MKKIFCLLLLAAAVKAGPVTLLWTNPNNQTNLGVNIYATTNLTTPTNQWPLFAYLPQVNPGTNSFSTNLPPANYYFIAAFTNSFWGVQSFFSDPAAYTPPLPTNLVTGLSVTNK